jgi:hypothetical protein
VPAENLRWRSAGNDLELNPNKEHFGTKVEVLSHSEDHLKDEPEGWRKAHIVN